jgi:hypothetical protein
LGAVPNLTFSSIAVYTQDSANVSVVVAMIESRFVFGNALPTLKRLDPKVTLAEETFVPLLF